MQQNEITLVVDKANNGTNSNVLFKRNEELANKTVYTGPGHSYLMQDTMSLYRTHPVRTGSFYGAAKTAVKITRSVSVPVPDGATAVYPLIAEISFSVPVGTPDAAVVEARQVLLSLLDRDDVVGALVKNGEI